MNRGFTVVEILVTLVVMAILLGLGTVGLRASLANGRDAERKADVEALAHALETRYDRGYTYSWQEDTNGDSIPETQNITVKAGTYPGNNELWDSFLWQGRARAADVMPGITDQALKSPSGNGMDAGCLFWMFPSEQPRCDAAEKESTIQGYFEDGNGGYKDKYFYEFVGADNKYCNIDDCVRYNIYYVSETDKTSYMGIPGLKVWRSKHQ